MEQVELERQLEEANAKLRRLQRHDRLWDFLFLALVFALIVGLMFASRRAEGAPVPWPKTTTTRPLSREMLVGDWNMTWAGTVYRVRFSRDGTYTAGTRNDQPGEWVGSWGTRDGRLWITESCTPMDPLSWRSYCAKLHPRRLRGPVVFGADGVRVTLTRRKP